MTSQFPEFEEECPCGATFHGVTEYEAEQQLMQHEADEHGMTADPEIKPLPEGVEPFKLYFKDEKPVEFIIDEAAELFRPDYTGAHTIIGRAKWGKTRYLEDLAYQGRSERLNIQEWDLKRDKIRDFVLHKPKLHVGDVVRVVDPKGVLPPYWAHVQEVYATDLLLVNDRHGRQLFRRFSGGEISTDYGVNPRYFIEGYLSGGTNG